ncbi:MAG: excisionase [Candidatus Ventricola sp.]
MEERIPISERYMLSVEEASVYFHIGVNRLRRLIKENQSADWVLWNQSHALIKRKKFEQLIDSINAL